ncbi:MAG TPA: NAD(P)/FAD-dependent oxidoreductase [Streptosporangiaceae bacterium]|jgi:NADH dehydrogenase
MTDRHRVVIIGGGFGGINVTRNLARADVEVTVVDRTNHHLFQPLLYQVAAGILAEGLIAPALRYVIRKQANARALLADVQDIDVTGRVVAALAPDGQRLALPYDTLVVASGAADAYFGRDEWAQFAPGMKTLEDARRLRSHILSAFEMAELAAGQAERARYLTFAVVGAGPTGVELAGQLAELAHQVLPRDYRSADTTEAKILLLDASPAVLSAFHPKLQRYAQRRLERMGVDVRLSTTAVAMDHDSITVRGPQGEEHIPAGTRIWAAGVQASPLARLLAEATGAGTDRAGRVAVRADCSLPGHPEIFAIGDMISLNRLPAVAQPAIQQGKYVGNLIRARLRGQATAKPFRYRDKGSMATIGHLSAVTESFGLRFTGVTGYTMWGFIHVLYLIDWGNRLAAMFSWARALTFAGRRPHRVIRFEQASYELAEPAPHQRRSPGRQVTVREGKLPGSCSVQLSWLAGRCWQPLAHREQDAIREHLPDGRHLAEARVAQRRHLKVEAGLSAPRLRSCVHADPQLRPSRSIVAAHRRLADATGAGLSADQASAYSS